MTLKKCKNKVDNLKAKWNIWVKLQYEVSGWGWDETTQLFIVSAEQWECYIVLRSRCNINDSKLLLTHTNLDLSQSSFNLIYFFT